MEVLYGIVLLIAFVLGIGIGLTIPFFVKKYMKLATTVEVVKPEETKKNNDQIPYIPRDLLNEWITGEEAKPNEQ